MATAGNDVYSSAGIRFTLNRDNLLQDLQKQLSQKEKKISEIFFRFSKSRFNFQHFQSKDDPHS